MDCSIIFGTSPLPFLIPFKTKTRQNEDEKTKYRENMHIKRLEEWEWRNKPHQNENHHDDRCFAMKKEGKQSSQTRGTKHYKSSKEGHNKTQRWSAWRDNYTRFFVVTTTLWANESFRRETNVLADEEQIPRRVMRNFNDESYAKGCERNFPKTFNCLRGGIFLLVRRHTILCRLHSLCFFFGEKYNEMSQMRSATKFWTMNWPPNIII